MHRMDSAIFLQFIPFSLFPSTLTLSHRCIWFFRESTMRWRHPFKYVMLRHLIGRIGFWMGFSKDDAGLRSLLARDFQVTTSPRVRNGDSQALWPAGRLVFNTSSYEKEVMDSAINIVVLWNFNISWMKEFSCLSDCEELPDTCIIILQSA